jgi:predicted dehydrogenase
MKPVKIGLIGCGKQSVKHISGFKKIPGVTVMLSDAVPSVARQLAEKEGLPYVNDPQEMLKDPSIDAVDICVPTSFHGPLIRSALNAGKSFFCEKPLCETLEEARDIQHLADKKKLTGMVGYVYRFSPIFELGKRLFEDAPSTGHSAVLGKITYAFLRLGGRGGHQLWKHMKGSGGGAMNEMMVHMIDMAIWYFGRVNDARLLESMLIRPERPVSGKTEKVDGEDFVLARLKMENGVEVFIQSDLLTPSFSQYVEVEGENGSFFGSIQPEIPSYVYCEKPAAGYPAGRTPVNFGSINLFEAQMASFVRSVRTGSLAAKSSIHDSILLFEAVTTLKGNMR